MYTHKEALLCRVYQEILRVLLEDTLVCHCLCDIINSMKAEYNKFNESTKFILLKNFCIMVVQ